MIEEQIQFLALYPERQWARLSVKVRPTTVWEMCPAQEDTGLVSFRASSGGSTSRAERYQTRASHVPFHGDRYVIGHVPLAAPFTSCQRGQSVSSAQKNPDLPVQEDTSCTSSLSPANSLTDPTLPHDHTWSPSREQQTYSAGESHWLPRCTSALFRPANQNLHRQTESGNRCASAQRPRKRRRREHRNASCVIAPLPKFPGSAKGNIWRHLRWKIKGCATRFRVCPRRTRPCAETYSRSRRGSRRWRRCLPTSQPLTRLLKLPEKSVLAHPCCRNNSATLHLHPCRSSSATLHLQAPSDRKISCRLHPQTSWHPSIRAILQ